MEAKPLRTLRSFRRKDKSLGLLVSNFLSFYNRDGMDLIGLDDAAAKLGVERRRIYDVVNILESIGLVARKGKSQYSWMGFGAVPRFLDQLKEDGMIEKIGIIPCVTNNEMVLYEQEREESFKLTLCDQENSSASHKLDNKKEKILCLLSENFVKLFLCSYDDLITLDSVTKALLDETTQMDPVNKKTKIRRIYDIANVFSSLRLIEKTHMPDSKKTAYRWLGFEAMYQYSLIVAASPSLGDGNDSDNRLIVAGSSTLGDGNEFENRLVVAGSSSLGYGNEFENKLIVAGSSILGDGNEFENRLIAGGSSSQGDGNESENKLIAGGSSRLVDGNKLIAGGSSRLVDGNRLIAAGSSRLVDDNRLIAGGSSSLLDGDKLIAGGSSSLLDGKRLIPAGYTSRVDGNRLIATGSSILLDGNKLIAGGSSSLLDGKRVIAAGPSSLGDGKESENKLIVAGSASLGDGKETKMLLFDTELSKLEAKRSKRYRFEDPKFWEKKEKKRKVKEEQNSDSKEDGKSSATGSATPAADNNNSGPRLSPFAQIEDLTAAYRPQYINPVIMGLFGHFKDTMHAWMEYARPK